MSSTGLIPDFLERLSMSITEELQVEANELTKIEIEKAKAEIEKQLRDAVSKIVMRVSDYYTFHDKRDHLVIEVHIPKNEKGGA